MAPLTRFTAGLLAIVLLAGSAVVFVRAQMLKNAPSPIVAPKITNSTFSPGAYKPQRREAILTVGLRQSDTATVSIVNNHGAIVARAATKQAGTKISASWDGTLGNGERAPDGLYRFTIALKRAQRLIRIPDPMRLDATPPAITSTAKVGQRISPGLAGEMGTYTFTLTADELVHVKLDVRQIQPDGTARLIRTEPRSKWLQKRQLLWSADSGGGLLDQIGPLVGPGSYIVGWRALDRAGNLVLAPAIVEPSQLAPARVVAVETVQLTPTLEPITLLGDIELIRHRPTRVFPGAETARSKGAPSAVALPRANAGLYAIEATGGGWSGWAPEAVPGRAPVLLLTPLYSWQATNPTDADLSGFPDVPPGPLTLNRPLTVAFKQQLAALARTGAQVSSGLGRRVGAITDLAIEDQGVPRGTRVLVIYASPIWTKGLVTELQAFTRRGGTILLIDDKSLTQEATRMPNAILLGDRTPPQTDALRVVRTISEAKAALPAAAG